MDEDTELSKKYKSILPVLSEKQRRIYLSIEANHFGYGGVSKVSKLSGVSRVVIAKGQKELEDNKNVPIGTSREKGGGRKKTLAKHPEIWAELKKRAMHLTQVATISCGYYCQLFSDLKPAAWSRHAALNGKIAILLIVKTYG